MVKQDKSQKKMDAYTKDAAGEGSRGGTAAAAAPRQVDQTVVLLDIQATLLALSAKLDTVVATSTGMQTALDTQKARMSEAEERIRLLEDTVAAVTTRLTSVEQANGELQRKNEDLENRSRRNNIRIVGVSESTAITNYDVFTEQLLKDILDDPPLSPMFMVERAHRSLGPRPKPGMPPRPIIARILNYRDRDVLLRAARLKGELKFADTKIMLFPDFSPKVQSARRDFLEVKAALRQAKVQYSMLFPAKLRIIANNKVMIFETPEQATEYVTQHYPEVTWNEVAHGARRVRTRKKPPRRTPRRRWEEWSDTEREINGGSQCEQQQLPAPENQNAEGGTPARLNEQS